MERDLHGESDRLMYGSTTVMQQDGGDQVEILDEPWHPDLEAQIAEWRQVAERQGKLHDTAGYHFKTKRTQYGLLPALIPLIMAPLSLIIITAYGWGMYFNAAVLTLDGLCTGLVHFFSPGEKMERHFSFSAQYADLVTEIDAEMRRKRQFRQSADVFMMKVKMNIDRLTYRAPIIPMFIRKNKKVKCGVLRTLCEC